MGLLEDIIKGMAQQGQQQQYPQQGGTTTSQPQGDISIQDLEREMGIGTSNSGNTYQHQYPQQQYPQQTGGSVIPGVDDYLPTNQGNTLPTGQQQQQLPGCSGGNMPGCSGGLWKILGLGALVAFLFRRKS